MGCGASTSAPATTASPTLDPKLAAKAARLTDVFKAMDKDGNGLVDLEEFLATAKAGDDKMELTMMFHFMDSVTNDVATQGKLTLDEWLKGIQTLNPSDAEFEKQMASIMEVIRKPSADVPLDREAVLRQLFQQIDASGDGKLQITEFKSLAVGNAAMAMQEAVFGMVDDNGDGVLSVDEFVKFNLEMGAKTSDADFEKQARQWSTLAKEARAANAAAPEMGPLAKKPLREFSGDEIRGVLAIFKQFDADSNGVIDAAELESLAATLMLEVTELQPFLKEGKLSPKDFFASYVECTAEEADVAFALHGHLFEALRAKSLKEWLPAEIKDILVVFKSFDKDGDGKIDEGELKELSAALGVDVEMGEADALVKDGVVDLREFFVFYTGCTQEEAENAFDQHTLLFATGGA